MSRIPHLIRRTISSISNRRISFAETDHARAVLLPREFDLWATMQPRDQRHSLLVLRRFDDLLPDATVAERRAALLHDVGKSVSNLGVVGRIAATIFGPRVSSFRTYLEHEIIGLALLKEVSEARTLEVLRTDASDTVSVVLRRADDV